MRDLKCITLEMSLKPFRSTEPEFIESVCREVFYQWGPLIRHSENISVLFWASDGSEILDYKGNLDDSFEWAKYIGIANRRMCWDKNSDPEGKGLHTRNYLYTENPPVFTYAVFKKILSTIKKVGHEMTGKSIRLGAAFDPGPEFAVSDFKYNRHPEILLGNTMGRQSFVCCYSVLHKDSIRYAGFPDGIPEGTPFGTFLGKQCQKFLSDLGFDYIWFSNGFGFGSEAWGITGAVFDGESFSKEKLDTVQHRIMRFWELFRKECSYRVETRGTNLSVGIDLASDGVNLKKIYEAGLNILPPPNSPWAALDGDFGLELAGYMSRIAELPDDEHYLFRFYVHDPWWMNSPWIDRYEGQPHDIYLPLAVSRINRKGEVTTPGFLNILTIDDSTGRMPEQCPVQIIPHLMKAYDHAPDLPSPFVWVYPFREYNELSAGRIEKPFFEDWFIRGAINQGLPLSTVVSTDNFITLVKSSPHLFNGSVVVTPVPDKGSKMNLSLIKFIEGGGKVLLYGSIQGADERLLDVLNVQLSSPVSGELDLELNMADGDILKKGSYGFKIYHDKLLSDGAIDTVMKNEDCFSKALAFATNEAGKRLIAIYNTRPQWNGGGVIWLRGTNCSSLKKGMRMMSPFSPGEYYPLEALPRLAVKNFGFTVQFYKETPESKSPVVMLHRNDNAFYFSGYVPDTTVQVRMRMPCGAPLFIGHEGKLQNDGVVYSMPRAFHFECRAFVEQTQDSVVSCREIAPVSFQMRRRIEITGLKNATVRIFPRKGFECKTDIKLNSHYPYFVGEYIKPEKIQTEFGTMIEVNNVTGNLVISERHL